VHVEVKHALSCSFPHVGYDPISRLVDALQPRHLGGRDQKLSGQARIPFLQLTDAVHVPTWDDQHVNGSLGLNVAEGYPRLAFGYDIRRNVAADDPAE
jgi:hypothetical protein